MSARIDECLDVIGEVYLSFASSSAGIRMLSSVRNYRIIATKDVARRRNIAERTVADKYARQLNLNSAKFGQLLFEFLSGEPGRLKEALIFQCVDGQDLNMVNRFFGLHIPD